LIGSDKRLIKYVSLVKPKTILIYWKKKVRLRWKYPSTVKRGRPPVTGEIKKLILEMKQLNNSWGFLRISGELKKIGEFVSKDTVRRVIQKGRNDGNIPPNGSWKRFIKSHIDSLFCCDFFTIETVFNKTLYVFFLMEMKTRKIIQFSITSNPTVQFIRIQLLGFMFDREEKKTHLIHDNSGELKWFDYKSIGITGVAITPYSPNLNAHAERFVKSAKTECFDRFIVFNRKQLHNLMR